MKYLSYAYLYVAFISIIVNIQVIDKNEHMAQNKLIRECKILVSQVQQSLGRMTGKIVDDVATEIGATLPFTTIEAVLDVDDKLENKEYAAAMVISI